MITLQKVHGSSNQFFILDLDQLSFTPSDEQIVALTQQLTASFLAGADGLLVVSKSDATDCLGKMRVINADGSEASMCGNGLRTVARYLSEKHQQSEFKVETLNAHLTVKKQADLAQNVPAFGVEISPIHFDNEYFPFNNLNTKKLINSPIEAFSDHLNFYAIAVPNPHLISFVEKDDDLNETLETLGTKLNQPNDYFPDGVNVNFAKILGQNELFVRTFERGVGFTNACGTGMSATSLAYTLHQNRGTFPSDEITVYNPGGVVKTIVHENWIELIGNATHTHTITISESQLFNYQFDEATVDQTNEQQSYEHFIANLKKQAD
ncbi:diaminopimelate epimerase [Holzapfeliella sp. He02]|uniref:Diaminopimelate epimerase n=1 Tax=Holzapfeliella saturejae TaxID=3082953 RepID=A0ABU8SHV5_9LACO